MPKEHQDRGKHKNKSLELKRNPSDCGPSAKIPPSGRIPTFDKYRAQRFDEIRSIPEEVLVRNMKGSSKDKGNWIKHYLKVINWNLIKTSTKTKQSDLLCSVVDCKKPKKN